MGSTLTFPLLIFDGGNFCKLTLKWSVSPSSPSPPLAAPPAPSALSDNAYIKRLWAKHAEMGRNGNTVNEMPIVWQITFLLIIVPR